MNFWKKIFLYFFIFSVLNAQNVLPEFEYITEENGLLNTTVECIFQDSFGFMWFGTWKGLIRYDGTNFRFYKIFSAHPRFVSSNEVTALAEDKNGYIWIGTLQGLIRLEPFSGANRTYRHNSHNPNTPSHDFITSLLTSEEAIWFGTQGGGLNELTLDTKGKPIHFSNYSLISDSPAKPGWNMVYNLIEDQRKGKNLLWIVTAEGLVRFEKTTKKFDCFPNKMLGNNSNELRVIHQDKRKQIWLGTSDGLLSHLSEDSSGAISLQHFDIFSGKMINHICDADNIYLWLSGIDGPGLIRFNTYSGKFMMFAHDPDNPRSPINNLISAMYQDCSGILWVGFSNVLGRFDPGRTKFRQSVAIPTLNKQYYHARKTPEILKSNNNKLWLGKHGYGLICIDSLNKQVINYRHIEDDPTSLCNDFIQVLYEDKLGTLWIGTQNGLDRFDQQGGYFIHYSNEPERKKSEQYLPGDLINDIYEDRNGSLWICNSAGIFRLNRSTLRFDHYLSNAKEQLRMTGNYLGTIYQDSQKRYWLGGRGLFRFYPDEDKIEPYFHKNGVSEFWIDRMVSVIYEDQHETLWVGTSGNGLYGFKAGGDVLNFTENNGFSGDYVMAILEDEQGFLWVSTYMGLTKVDPLSGTFKNYGKKDGLTYNYFQLRSASKDKYGKMYFGQNSGYTEFVPTLIKDNSNKSQIVIDEIYIFNQEVKPRIPAKGYSQLILPYNQNMITFKYILLNFTNSRLNNYSYMLEGIDKHWNHVGKVRTASYSNLPAGEYTFIVKGQNSDGVWNEQGAKVKIVILPPWWRTWWAYTLYVMLTIIVLFSGFRFETNRREMRHRAVVAELQAKTLQAQKEAEQEQMRSRIAGDLHDEIGGNLSSIVLLGETLERHLKPTGKEKKRLREIRSIAKATADAMRDIVWFVNPMNDDMDKLFARMRQTANTMLEGIYLNIDIHRESNLNWEGDLNFRRNVFLLFKEALQNVLCHSQATKVCIVIHQNKQLFHLEIKDNGIGFETTSSFPGNGLKNFKRRAKEMGAQLTITSKPGEGTTVLLIKKIP